MRLLDEELWTLHRRHAMTGNKDEIAYVIGPTAKQVWEQAVEEELLGTGHTKETLMAQGWRAVKIGVIVT